MQKTHKAKKEVHQEHKLSKEEFDNMKPMNGYVICKRLGDNVKSTTPSGIQKTNEAWNKNEYVSQNVERVFEVVKIPDELEEQYGYWKTQIDVEVGDIIFVQYLDSINSVVVISEDEEYRAILYYNIICKKKGDQLQPVNGNILFTTVPLEFKTTLELPPEIKNATDPRYGKVEFVCPKNEYYTKGAHEDMDGDVEVNQGDKVVFNMDIRYFARKVENPLHQILDKHYLYCQRYRIGGKF